MKEPLRVEFHPVFYALVASIVIMLIAIGHNLALIAERMR